MIIESVKQSVHKILDPVIAEWRARKYRKLLTGLPQGTYSYRASVPYYSQFASPELTNAYIHHGYDARHDPRWKEFGSNDPEEYAFWSWRACGIVCLKMIIEAQGKVDGEPSIMSLINQGLDLNGYIVHDEEGKLVDKGWFYRPLIKLGEKYGLTGRVHVYSSLQELCYWISCGHLVVASVSPEIGEVKAPITKYGGHLVVVYGFIWSGTRCQAFLVHNPSGRETVLRSGSVIPYDRFKEAYAYRMMTFFNEKDSN